MTVHSVHSVDEYVALRNSEYIEEYNRAAHEDAPLRVWLEIIETHPEMRRWVAHNRTVPLEILAVLADDSDPMVRGVVARKRKIPESLQRKLAADLDSSVRFAVACNAKATLPVLQSLAQDDEEFVRVAVQIRLRKTE